MKAVFLRALEETEDKNTVLRAAIQTPRKAMGHTRFDVDPAAFRLVSRSPFAYWVSDRTRRLFTEFPALESSQRFARQGGVTGDDFRYLRLLWEIPLKPESSWKVFAKGGEFSRFYSPLHLAVQWDDRGRTFHGFAGLPHRPSLQPASCSFYFRPGLTWSLRTQSGLALRAMPRDCVFGHRGPAAFVEGDRSRELLALLAIANSRPFRTLADLQTTFGSYEVGVVQRIPVPETSETEREGLAQLALRYWGLKRSIDTATESSQAFYLPAVLQMDEETISARLDAWNRNVGGSEEEISHLEATIDGRCFELYGIDGADREQIERGLGGSTGEDEVSDAEDDEDEVSEAEESDVAPLVASLLSWSVGVAFGCLDIRLATGERPAPPEPEPFDHLPVCSPGMLTGEKGLPLDAAPAGYAIDFPRDGILVDDAGAPRDIVAAARRAFEQVFNDPAARWEEAVLILGERDRTLRQWFAREFFGLHLKQYSKSRRKAPIYWPLSTASGSYTVWLYYHRLTGDTLFQVVVEFMDPKIRKVQEERHQADGRRGQAEAREAAKLAKEATELAELERELEEMKAEVLRVAGLPYKPDLNDGVQITAAPLWRLFRLPAWRKELEATWREFERGEYDWAHLAYAIWPERVREKCKTDRSLAIAHGLEDVFREGDPPPTRSRSRRRS